MIPLQNEKIILGIDPGTHVMGYGVVKQVAGTLSVLQYGVVHSHRYPTHTAKLKNIFEHTGALISDFTPHEMALEAPFYGKNVQSMLKLGRAQGVIMAAAFMHQIAVIAYAPNEVKQAVTGSGHASKEQVAHMLMNLLGLPKSPAALDASDALAIAVCHAYQHRQPPKKTMGWKALIRKNERGIGS